jgi:site-specific recombinase XerD
MKNKNTSAEFMGFYSFFKEEQTLSNLSKNTINSYKNTIFSFNNFLLQYDKDILLENLTKIDIIKFLDYKNMILEKMTELKPSSKKLYLNHLKKYFIFINDNSNYNIDINKILNIRIKLPVRVPKGILPDDQDKLLSYLDTLEINTLSNVRNRLMIKIILYSGARISEVLKLETYDLLKSYHEDIYIVNTIGKGDKERTLFVPKKVIEDELLYYINNNIKYICVSTRDINKVLNRTKVYTLFNNIYKKAGIKNSGTHVLRHTFAKNMTDNNINPIMLKEMLGHSDINTTMIYANPHKQQVAKAYLEKIEK